MLCLAVRLELIMSRFLIHTDSLYRVKLCHRFASVAEDSITTELSSVDQSSKNAELTDTAIINTPLKAFIPRETKFLINCTYKHWPRPERSYFLKPFPTLQYSFSVIPLS